MNIFVNQDEGRLRAGWRLAAQIFFTYLLTAILIWILSRIGFLGTRLRILIFGFSAVLSIVLAARGLDYRRWSDFGLGYSKQHIREYGAGFALAALVISLIFIIEYSAGWVTMTGWGWQQPQAGFYFLSFTSYFLFMVMVGFYEELLFRGYHIVNLSEGFNGPRVPRPKAVIGSVVLSSLVFAALHGLNPNASWRSTINIACAGAMLAFPFIITGRLSFSVGLHIGWNFTQGGIFGFSVSGLPAQESFLHINQSGPVWITGGSFGPEGGLIGFLGIVIIIVGTIFYLHRQEQPLAIAPGLGVYTPSADHYPI